MSLRDDLSEWSDWDGAGVALAKHLGLIETTEAFGGRKGIFWSNNPVGNALTDCLNRLTEATILERRDEPDIQFRWNQSFSLDALSAKTESDFTPGDMVRLVSTGEIGRIVSTWNDDGATDCYVAFFGDSCPNGKPADKPYVLRYYTSSLERFEPKRG